VQPTSCGASEADLFYPLLSLNIFLHSLLSPVLTITMSFSFSFSDFVAVLQLANNIRKQFVDAPSQFKAISGE
jgi:hypothetical protein